jgi:hypothetical protein
VNWAYWIQLYIDAENARMSKIYLKIKLMSLAEESKIIRRQEHNLVKRYRKLRSIGKEVSATSDGLLASIHHHRVREVRCEARSAHLAYGYLRETPYRAMEWRCENDNQPDWRRVLDIAKKFGAHKLTAETLAAWAEVPAVERKAA